MISLKGKFQSIDQIKQAYSDLRRWTTLLHLFTILIQRFYNYYQLHRYQVKSKMIPCRVFLQQIHISPEIGSNSKPKLSLTLNSIYYDELKPFQTKYFCLTSQDVVGVEAMLPSEDGSDQNLIGRTDIENALKLAVESQVVQIKINVGKKTGIKEVRILLSFEPVSAFSKRMLDASCENGTKRVDKFLQEDLGNNESQNQLEISFSHREPRQEVYSTMNLTKDFKFRDTYKDVPLFAESLKSLPQEAESLESLAQQREKILGELFGRFKPIK